MRSRSGASILCAQPDRQRIGDVQCPLTTRDALPVGDTHRAVGQGVPVGQMRVLVQQCRCRRDVDPHRPHQRGVPVVASVA